MFLLCNQNPACENFASALMIKPAMISKVENVAKCVQGYNTLGR